MNSQQNVASVRARSCFTSVSPQTNSALNNVQFDGISAYSNDYCMPWGVHEMIRSVVQLQEGFGIVPFGLPGPLSHAISPPETEGVCF